MSGAGGRILGGLALALLAGCAPEVVTDRGEAEVPGVLMLFQSFFPSADVQIRGTNPGGLRLSYAVRWDVEPAEFSFSVDEATGVATASIDCHLNYVCEVELVAEVDPAVAIRVDTLVGPITVEDVAGAVELSVQTGDVALARLSGTAQVGVETGEVTGEDLACPDLYVGGREGGRTIGYGALAEGAPLAVALRTVAGDIDLSVPTGAYAVDVEATGAVDVEGIEDDPTQTRTIGAVTGGGSVSIRGY